MRTRGHAEDSDSESTADEDDLGYDDAEIEGAVRTLFEWWKGKSNVAIEKVDVQPGSVILTLRLELPVALILFQLAQPRSAALAELGVRCCLLDKVARLDDGHDQQAASSQLESILPQYRGHAAAVVRPRAEALASGLGTVKQRNLEDAFATGRIRAATEEELRAVPKIGSRLAERLRRALDVRRHDWCCRRLSGAGRSASRCGTSAASRTVPTRSCRPKRKWRRGSQRAVHEPGRPAAKGRASCLTRTG